MGRLEDVPWDSSIGQYEQACKEVDLLAKRIAELEGDLEEACNRVENMRTALVEKGLIWMEETSQVGWDISKDADMEAGGE